MPSNRNGPIGFGVSFGSLCFIISVITDVKLSDVFDCWFKLLWIDDSGIVSGADNESGGGPTDEIIELAAVIRLLFGCDRRSFGRTVIVGVVDTAVSGGGLDLT